MINDTGLTRIQASGLISTLGLSDEAAAYAAQLGLSDEEVGYLRTPVDLTMPRVNFQERERAYRYRQGYTDEIVALGNDMYPTGTELRIKLDSFIKWRPIGELLAANCQTIDLQHENLHGFDDCRPAHLVGNDHHVPLAEPIRGRKTMRVPLQKIVAIFKSKESGGVPDIEMYKAVANYIYDPNGLDDQTVKLWETSARCPF